MDSSFSFSFTVEADLLHHASPQCTPTKPSTSTPHSNYRPRVNFHSIDSIINHSPHRSSESFSRLDDTGYQSMPSSQQIIVERSKQRKPRRKFTNWQNWYLRQVYSHNRYPTSDEQDDIARQLSLPVSSIRIWFQNYRARQGKN